MHFKASVLAKQTSALDYGAAAVEVSMNVGVIKLTHMIVLGVCFIASHVWAQSDAQFLPQDFKTKSVFELLVNDSSVLKAGASRIVTQSAYVTLVRGLIPGNSEGLEIQFFTKPTTQATIVDVLQNGAKESKKGDYAALVLFLDKG